MRFRLLICRRPSKVQVVTGLSPSSVTRKIRASFPVVPTYRRPAASNMQQVYISASPGRVSVRTTFPSRRRYRLPLAVTAATFPRLSAAREGT